MKKTVLITGATGFIGRHVFKELIVNDFLIKVVVRPQSAIKIQVDDKVKLIFTDNLFCESERWWQKHCKGVDIVIHLAWNVEPGKYLESESNLECLSGSLRLAVGAAKSKVEKFIGIGTCFEYDVNQLKPLAINSPLLPQTLYAQSKLKLFDSCTALFKKYEIDFAWCRLFYIYGEGEDERRFVSYIMNKLSKGYEAELTSGNQVRDFLDVTEVAKMLSSVVQGDYRGPINICSGRAVTLKHLAEQIADIYGRRDLLKFGARPENITDPLYVVGIPTIDVIF